MVSKYRFDICDIQETKLVIMKKLVCKSLWIDQNFDWACKASSGRSRGILTIWNHAASCKTSEWFLKGLLVVNGYWCETGRQCLVLNVYTPGSLSDKLLLWDSINLIIEQYDDACICVLADFNSITNSNERVGRGITIDHRDIRAFNDFITNSSLIDLPLSDSSITCYRPDDTCKNSLDRMLVKETWLQNWPNQTLKVLEEPYHTTVQFSSITHKETEVPNL